MDLEIQRSQYIRPKVTVHKCAETIQGKKLFKGGNYMSKYGIIIFSVLGQQECLFTTPEPARGTNVFTKECSIWYDLKAYLLLSGERKKWSSYTIPALWLLPRTISGPARQGRFLNKICPPGPECDVGYVDPPNFGKKPELLNC